VLDWLKLLLPLSPLVVLEKESELEKEAGGVTTGAMPVGRMPAGIWPLTSTTLFSYELEVSPPLELKLEELEE